MTFERDGTSLVPTLDVVEMMVGVDAERYGFDMWAVSARSNVAPCRWSMSSPLHSLPRPSPVPHYVPLRPWRVARDCDSGDTRWMGSMDVPR